MQSFRELVLAQQQEFLLVHQPQAPFSVHPPPTSALLWPAGNANRGPSIAVRLPSDRVHDDSSRIPCHAQEYRLGLPMHFQSKLQKSGTLQQQPKQAEGQTGYACTNSENPHVDNGKCSCR